jgi:hypothetical protein
LKPLLVKFRWIIETLYGKEKMRRKLFWYHRLSVTNSGTEALAGAALAGYGGDCYEDIGRV